MEWNGELKREIPDGWDVFKLEDILRCNYESITQDEQYEFINYLDTSNLTESVIDNVQFINLEHDTRPSRAQRIVKQNDILYSTVRPNQHHYGIIKDPIENLIASTGFAQLTSKKEAVTNELIYLYLTSESSINRLQQIADSSVSSYPSISPNDILGLNLPLPKDEKILNMIGAILEPLFQKTLINHNQNQHLAELRDWLLPMLMNGQVTVDERALQLARTERQFVPEVFS
jgi:type I restriction enzyme S subunit